MEATEKCRHNEILISVVSTMYTVRLELSIH